MTETRLEVQQTQKLSQGLQTIIHLLSLDLNELSEYMFKAVQENPALEYVPPRKSPQDYAMQVRTRYSGGRRSAEETDLELAASPETDIEDLEQQLRLSRLDADTVHLARHILHLLSSRGYFTEDLDAFAVENGVSPEMAQRALEAVQSLEPAGIGARSVEECLELQLRSRQSVDPLCYDLIRLHLLDIGKGDLRRIARETGAAMERIRHCVDTIRRLSPAPCSLHSEAVQYIMPEFSVEADSEGKLTILFHNDYYPSFRPDANFRRLSETLTGEEAAYARRMLSSATQMIRAVEMRQSTMEKIAGIIVREQHAYFLGQYSLIPLRIDETAKELGIHEATVYRAIQGKYLYCSRGTFPLSYFFQKSLSGGVSTARVKEIIREICQSDDRLSDRAITEELQKRGITLSRRTVAKYRSQLEISSSFTRSTNRKE
ncbi:MAG: RNA polymerase factor sigma-54 [Clostridia bacterium]|nr:RNA polymerase factor sigma-54 [Clostridia bacterium]